MLGKILFKIARSPVATLFIGWAFAYFSFAIPVKRLRETETLMAFYHPKPSWAFHVLIVPKRAVAKLPALSPKDSDFMNDLFQTVASLVAEFNLEERGYRLLANGGPYQDVPQLHFHLLSEGDL
jgi:histidine triad (HIT) family protein